MWFDLCVYVTMWFRLFLPHRQIECIGFHIEETSDPKKQTQLKFDMHPSEQAILRNRFT